MKQKSITFRCSAAQGARLESAVNSHRRGSRSAILSEALEDFLAFVEREDIATLNLFQLVERIDSAGNGKRFAEHA